MNKPPRGTGHRQQTTTHGRCEPTRRTLTCSILLPGENFWAVACWGSQREPSRLPEVWNDQSQEPRNESQEWNAKVERATDNSGHLLTILLKQQPSNDQYTQHTLEETTRGQENDRFYTCPVRTGCTLRLFRVTYIRFLLTGACHVGEK